ncbi:hypothetical protein KHC23_06750 [Ancylobacter dichloromethanicus]|uniref:Uncharacterized protein n=1 Tax=Ancylobacter dichloromethanicus TaxID=518825 RepID=A0A9W6JCA2_9HYPH|nr:hypothetical protein [Ancylobacter dichloromethanicus]MBS7553346.1 hypothetical protein [Ancylobacter dichloromethanicus]GLK73129.1 hypothetical protein GCM10017643_32450 [Ancylobacter dichloromethanicus]
MDSLLRLLLRFVIVPLGMICGFIASFVVVLFGYWRIGDLLAGNVDVEAIALFDALAAASYLLMMVVLAMWAVALIGVLFAEAFAVRSWIFHVANGAVSAWLAASVFAPYAQAPVPFDGNLYIVAAGLAGGLAYWLVAGWNAGFWKPLRAERLPAPLPQAQPASQPAPPPAP